jgi:NADPH:quinone reductase-like Zn-dependent oxidoreductase
LTAWRAVAVLAEAGPGKTILVPGAGGGVATFAVQIAHALGARVLVTSSSEEKLERARGLGAHDGADYRDDNWPERLAPVDAVIDSAGTRWTARELRRHRR